MKNLVSRFVNNEAGVTAIEYGLIAALIAVVIIASVTLVGTSLSAVFTAISAALCRAFNNTRQGSMKTLVSRFVTDESGVTAIEYGLIAALIAVVIITAITSVGSALQSVLYGQIAAAMAAAP